MKRATTWAATVHVACPHAGCSTVLLSPAGNVEHSRNDRYEGGVITCVGCGERYRLPMGYVLIWGANSGRRMVADFESEARSALQLAS